MSAATPDESGARRALRWAILGVDRVTDLLALSLLVFLVLSIAWQVFSRYGLGSTPRWTSETALVLIGWVGFLGIAIGIRERSHVAISFVVDRFPAGLRAAAERLAPLLMLLFGGYLLVQGWEFTVQMMGVTLPSTGLPRSVQYGAMPVSGVLVLLYSFLQLAGLNTAREIGAAGEDHGDAGTTGGNEEGSV